jgi:hypothetical protein
LIEITNLLNRLKDRLSKLASICHESKYFDLKHRIVKYELELKNFRDLNENASRESTQPKETPEPTVDIKVDRKVYRKEYEEHRKKQHRNHSSHHQPVDELLNVSKPSPAEKRRSHKSATRDAIWKLRPSKSESVGITPLKIEREKSSPYLGVRRSEEEDTEEGIGIRNRLLNIWVRTFYTSQKHSNSHKMPVFHYVLPIPKNQLKNG